VIGRETNELILLVEDNPDDRELALLAFKGCGISNEVVTCNDGEQALDYLFGLGAYAGRDTRILPRVVLLDLKLPKVDGFETLRRVRANDATRLLPVVVLTTSTEEKDMLECYRLGANSCVCKPVDFSRFTEVAREMAAYWLSVSVNPPANV
jgi:two-component system, response regulator